MQDHSLHFLRGFRAEFHGPLLVVLDNASYFTANRVQSYVTEVDDLELFYLPLYSPDMTRSRSVGGSFRTVSATGSSDRWTS